jgi:multicomponent Na+:H+ antiporter subunit B
MKKIIIGVLLLVIGYILLDAFADFQFGQETKGLKDFFIEHSVSDLKVANVVTSIVVNYRGFDTLGEVTVLFIAATGLSTILYRRRSKHTGLNPLRTSPQASSIVQATGKLLFPLIIMLGAYVFIHGHLTPGGGFQGGAIIATGFLLLLISYRRFKVEHAVVLWVESLAGITFVTIGILGLVYGPNGEFLENFLPVGKLNDLFSGGVVGLIYVAVGFKVAAEITGVLDTLVNIRETGDVKEIETEIEE